MTLRRFAVAALAVAAFGGQAALAQDASEAPKHHKAHHAPKKAHHKKVTKKKAAASKQKQADEAKTAPDSMKSDMTAPAESSAAPAAPAAPASTSQGAE